MVLVAAVVKGAMAAHVVEDSVAVAEAPTAHRADDDDVPVVVAVAVAAAAVLVSPCSCSGQPAALAVSS
jgi:hypothetical protein